MQESTKGLKKDPLDIYDEDEEDMPAHLSQFMESTDLTQPIFLLADDDDLDDPLKVDDPALSAMLSGTIDWTTDEYTLEDTPDPLKDLQDQLGSSDNDKDSTRQVGEANEPVATLPPTKKGEEPLSHPQQRNHQEDSFDTDQEQAEPEVNNMKDVAIEEEEGDKEKGKEKVKEEGGEDNKGDIVSPTLPIEEEEGGDDYQEEATARFRGELMRQSVDMAKLRSLCKTYRIPDALRGDIWKVSWYYQQYA